MWGVVLILNKTGVHAIDFPERARRNTRNYNQMSPRTEQLVYEIECVLRFVWGSLRNYKVPPFKGEKKLPVFSPAAVSGPPPTPGAGGIPVFVPSSCDLPFTPEFFLRISC